MERSLQASGPKPKIVFQPETELMISHFRYINKKGDGVSSRHEPVFKRRTTRVKVIHSWVSAEDNPFYQGAAMDPSLLTFLAKHADPRENQVYFNTADIFDIYFMPQRRKIKASSILRGGPPSA